MKRIVIAVAISIGLAIPAWEQNVSEHAPTIEKCRADLHFDNHDHRLTLPSAVVLNLTLAEFQKCEDIDPENLSVYQRMEYKITVVYVRRLQEFLFRHDLYMKFTAEDEAGRR